MRKIVFATAAAMAACIALAGCSNTTDAPKDSTLEHYTKFCLTHNDGQASVGKKLEPMIKKALEEKGYTAVIYNGNFDKDCSHLIYYKNKGNGDNFYSVLNITLARVDPLTLKYKKIHNMKFREDVNLDAAGSESLVKKHVDDLITKF